MQWLFLLLAGLAEVAFAFCLGKAKLAGGSAALGWYAAFAGCAALSFYWLNLSLAHIPLGTAYAVWTGIGALGTATVGILVFGDALLLRARCLAQLGSHAAERDLRDT